MARNLADTFHNLDDESNTLVDYFIESIHVRLLGCGIKSSSTERVNNFLLPAFLVVYYKKGSVEIQHGSETTILKPGSFYLFRPYDVYSGKKIGEEPICFAYLLFDIAPFMERYNFGTIAMESSDSIFQEIRYHRLGEILAGLAEDSPARSGRTAMLRQLVKLILGQIVYDQSRQKDDGMLLKKGRESKIINHAFQYVAEHLSAPIVISDIMKDRKTSKTSMERAFHNMLGMTPQRALLRFKIERSMEMLLQDASLKDIAKALGFSSVFHFSNTFKAVTGLRPTEYRNKIIKKHLGSPD